MKTTSKLIVTAAVIMLSACQKEEVSVPSTFPADGVIRVATNVNALQTRAGWDDTHNPLQKDFSIWITTQGETGNSSYIYKQKKMHYASNAWTAYEWLDVSNEAPMVMLWKNNTTPIDVVALFLRGTRPKIFDQTSTAPYKDNISADQSASDNVALHDYLYFKGTVDPTLSADETDGGGKITKYAPIDGKIRIPFRHINSKLALTVTLGTEFNAIPGTTTNPLTELKVNGTGTAFELNLSTGEIIKNSAAPIVESILPFHNIAVYSAGTGTTKSAVAQYECILVPQNVATGFTVTFKIGNKEYEWQSSDAVNFESGKQYALALTAGKDIVTLDGFTASEWTASTGGNIETE